MIIWLWNEKANATALADCQGGLPLLTICDEDFTGINPFYSYPLSLLRSYGWIVIGEL